MPMACRNVGITRSGTDEITYRCPNYAKPYLASIVIIFYHENIIT